MTTFLAQFWGLVFTIVGVVFLIKRDNMRMLLKLTQDDAFMVLTGYAALMVGIAHILIFNNWVNDWTVILTLIGWMVLLKGVVRLAFPGFAKKMIKSYDSSLNVTLILVVVIALGVYLLKQGFGL